MREPPGEPRLGGNQSRGSDLDVSALRTPISAAAESNVSISWDPHQSVGPGELHKLAETAYEQAFR